MYCYYNITTNITILILTAITCKLPAVGCSKIEGVDDAAEFREVLQAMNTLQFSSSTVESMLKVIAAILLLGRWVF